MASRLWNISGDIETGVNKAINRAINNKLDNIMRKRSIEVARVIRERIAMEAEYITPAGADLIRSLKIEKRDNWGSGYNADVLKGGSVNFRFTINPAKTGMTNILGHNPAWALLSSNFGRRGFSASDYGKQLLAIATNKPQEASKWRGQPINYNGVPGWYVKWVTKVRPQHGTHWIEATITSTIPQVQQILKGM